MIEVCSFTPDSGLVAEFRKWVESEWGDVDPFERKDGKDLPAPILALNGGELVGGLSFTYSSLPDTEKVGLWINTLLVTPGLRRMGVGSKLIMAAESHVNFLGINELYAFTQRASIYQKLGWKIFSRSEEGTILWKQISRNRGLA